MITHNGIEVEHERRMSIQAILNDEVIVIECPDDSGDVRAQRGIIAVIAGNVYSRTDQEAPNGRRSPIGLLPSIHILDFEVPAGIGDIQPGVVPGEKAAATHSAAADDALSQSASEPWFEPDFATSNKRDDCEAPAKVETLSTSGNHHLEDDTRDDWRRDARTRNRVRQILGIPEVPGHSTTPQSTTLKPPPSEKDLILAKSDSTLSSIIILPKVELASEPGGDGIVDKSDLSDIPKDIERGIEKQGEGPSRCVGSGIERRYDPIVIQLVDQDHLVPRACQGSSPRETTILMCRCRVSKQFCDRGEPCGRCLRAGTSCQRADGSIPGGYRRSQGINRKNRHDQPPKRPYNSDGIQQAVPKRPKCKVEDIIPLSTKPQPIGKPLVWADTRQELCEGVPYFRSYQGGIYFRSDLVRGYMLDAFGAERDFIGSHVVISHGGGRSSVDPSTNIRSLTASQSCTDRGVSALLSNWRSETPLVLIVGSRCPTSPCERDSSTSFLRWKFRFEKLGEEPGWWTPFNEAPAPAGEIPIQECVECKKPSPMVYSQGWMCLNEFCTSFWNIDGEIPVGLTYLPVFTSPTPAPTSLSLRIPPHDLRPPLVLDKDLFYNGNDVAKIFWQGICCPRCGRLNSREFFSHWECFGCHNFSHGSPNRTIYTAVQLDTDRLIHTGVPIIMDWVKPGSEVITSHLTLEVDGGFIRCGIYEFGKVGKVIHMIPSVQAKGGADEMLLKYQTQDIPFRRYRMVTGKVDGGMLSQQFMHNAGEPYKFVVQTASQPLEEAAPVIREAIDLIQQRANLLLGCDFNEILSVAYMEGQRMDYHDDGEPGVHDIVASISLGSTAVMKFRPKRKKGERFGHAIPFDVDEATDDEFDVPEHRRFFGPTQLLTPPESLEDQRRRKFKYTRDVLRLNLHHGDILIQQGSGLQKLYEHAAVPLGMRIVATARYINTEIHVGNTSPDVPIDLTSTIPIADEIVVEAVPIVSKNTAPRAVEPEMSEPLPPAPFIPRLPPLSFPPPPILSQPSLLSDRFPWVNGWNMGGLDGVFPPSNVREERPPVILPSNTGTTEGWTSLWAKLGFGETPS